MHRHVALQVVLASVLFGVSPRAQGDIAASVVRIVNQEIEVEADTPWKITGPYEGVGSGFLLEGGRILTNAHVIARSRLVIVFLHDDPDPHQARIVTAGHDCDLALLELVEPDVVVGRPHLEIGELPEIGTEVETFGYPEGGQRMSSTRGVVSRIEVSTYSHTGADRHLAVQTDAAINPGNSGGPVVQAGRVVGVAFQGIDRLDNVGYFIPTSVVRHFLDDVADGTYAGFPKLGIWTATMTSPAARRRAGMERGESGVRVHRILPGSSAAEGLRVGDVLLGIDGVRIANDATVPVHGLRLHMHVVIDAYQVGEAARVDVLRDGERQIVEVTMRRGAHPRELRPDFDALPRYFIYGGLVFAPMSREFLASSHSYEYEIFVAAMRDEQRMAREPVVLLKTLPHAVNSGMPWRGSVVVERVNGKVVANLEDLVRAVEENEGRYQVFEYTTRGKVGVVERAAADRAGPEILTRYGIAEDRRL